MLIAPLILPIIFWAAYHYHKDRHLPEPIGHLSLAFILGIGSYWLGIAMYEGLGILGLRHDASLLAETSPISLFFYALFVIGPIEELAKFIPFIFVVIRFSEFDEPIDGIIYASFIALGFSAVENFYYLQYVSNLEAIARGFAGPVIHMALASIWGYYVGVAYISRQHLFRAILLSLAAAALLHGLFDYLVIALPRFALPMSALLILGVWIWRMALLRILHRKARDSAGI